MRRSMMVGIFVAAVAIVCSTAAANLAVPADNAPLPASPSVAQDTKAPQLAKSHSGWRQTGCLECHDSAAMGAAHKDAASLGPADCGPCHGFNGAPNEAHAIPFNPCASCHARVPHAASFKVPDDCVKCHQQESGDRRQARGKH